MICVFANPYLTSLKCVCQPVDITINKDKLFFPIAFICIPWGRGSVPHTFNFGQVTLPLLGLRVRFLLFFRTHPLITASPATQSNPTQCNPDILCWDFRKAKLQLHKLFVNSLKEMRRPKGMNWFHMFHVSILSVPYLCKVPQ